MGKTTRRGRGVWQGLGQRVRRLGAWVKCRAVYRTDLSAPFRAAVDSSFKGNRRRYQQPVGLPSYIWNPMQTAS